jgi:NAD(P)-dependent dehydrogenase (short-subunit alcohol dehydrogenase family)
VLAVARDRSRLDRLAHGRPGIDVVVADLATHEGRTAMYECVRGDEPIESVVHGAGSRVTVEPFGAIDPERLVEDFRVHVAAVVAITQYFATRAERFVVFDSYSATAPRSGWAGYSIVKAAAHMAARAAATEIEGPEVLRLYPGAVRTPLLDAMLRVRPLSGARCLSVDGSRRASRRTRRDRSVGGGHPAGPARRRVGAALRPRATPRAGRGHRILSVRQREVPHRWPDA